MKLAVGGNPLWLPFWILFIAHSLSETMALASSKGGAKAVLSSFARTLLQRLSYGSLLYRLQNETVDTTLYRR